jgi:hypothetical protein
MKISKENLVFLLIGGIIILIILNASSPRKLVNEIKRSYKGFISNIYYQRGYHIVINTGVEEIDMTSFTYAFMCTVDKGDGIYKAANENYVTLIKSDSSLIKSSYLYINPSVRNDWRWPDEWENKWKDSSFYECDSCICNYRFKKYN